MEREGKLVVGEALNALVAERVLGWVPESWVDPINGLIYSHLRRNPSRDGPMWLHDNPPAVSTSVEAAWQVVEALGAASVTLTLSSVRSFGEAGITYPILVDHHSPHLLLWRTGSASVETEREYTGGSRFNSCQGTVRE
jgi:hypothetical protein